MPQIVEAIAKSRREANKVKREQPITVVIGNPPYKEKAEGRGGWIEKGAGGSSMRRSIGGGRRGMGRRGALAIAEKSLRLLLAMGDTESFRLRSLRRDRLAGHGRRRDCLFHHRRRLSNGPGFEKMRDDLRRTCSEIWVIDCSPEGHQPDVPTRIFEGVQQPVCIVLAARKLEKDEQKPAHVRYRALTEGRRAAKFKALAAVSLETEDWVECPADWRAPFLPKRRENGQTSYR